MFTIEFILPYSNLGPSVEQAFNEHLQKNNMACRISFIAHDRVKSSELKGDIIIARGLTASFLNQMLKGSFTVLEIPMTGYDILRAKQKANQKYGDVKVALIATESAIYGFEEQMKDVITHVKTYEIAFDSDIDFVIKKAISDGAGAIIGGNEVVSMAEGMGYNGVRIETGRQGIRQVIDEAWKIHISKLEEALRASRLNAVIENIQEGIIACDRDKRITICNAFAQGILGKPISEVVGKPLREVEPGLDTVPFNSLQKNETGYFLTINGTRIVVTRIPVIVNNNFESGTIVLQKVSNIEKLENENRIFASSKGLIATHKFKDIIGSSHAMNNAKQLAINYSRVSANVLILGETGTGKELFAQSIHNASDRKNNPFVAVNCAALPESLLESELFGYVEGAFTGALKSGKAGLFELAHRGTIFLDEISEMSFALQGRLLRVLEERSIMRLGHDKVIPIDVRIIAASNQNLEQLVEERKFRQDLFYRLDVLRLSTPPLRARIEDIPELMVSFITHFDNKNKMQRHMIDPSIFPYLQSLSWPGNVRQLRNLCERLSAIVVDSVITHESISMFTSSQFSERAEIKSLNEKENIMRALDKCGGNKSAAAALINIDRSTLYRKLRKYNMM